MRKILVLMLMCACALGAVAQTRLPITEKIEWTWTDRPVKPVPGLPNVLLVGDSITRGYFPAVTNDLKGVANVYLFASSICSGDPRLPEQIRIYFNMMGVKFAVVHFNNGMHGWGYTEQQYAAGLPGMIAAARAGAPHAKLIWANTTPVLHDGTTPGGPGAPQASNARIDARNELAATLMHKEHIAVDDLHGLMLQHQDLHNGDVHYTDAGYAVLAQQAANRIKEALEKK